MPSLQDLRRKIASVKNTQKITKAMKMVAAAKLKRAQDRILSARPYALKLRGVVANLGEHASRTSHPLLHKRDGNKTELLVVTSDRGLCGAFNANILRRAFEVLSAHQNSGEQVTVSLVGRKSIDFFRRRSWSIRQEWPGVFDRLSYEHALDIGRDIVQQYNEGAFDQLYVVYNEFKSVMQQRVLLEKLLPIGALEEATSPEFSVGPKGSYLYEPDEDDYWQFFYLNILKCKHFASCWSLLQLSKRHA